MTGPEREHFARRVHDLERRLRRWQLVAFVLAALLLAPVAAAGLLRLTVHRPWSQRLPSAEEWDRAAGARAGSPFQEGAGAPMPLEWTTAPP
jgi:hypothetical protein